MPQLDAQLADMDSHREKAVAAVGKGNSVLQDAANTLRTLKGSISIFLDLDTFLNIQILFTVRLPVSCSNEVRRYIYSNRMKGNFYKVSNSGWLFFLAAVKSHSLMVHTTDGTTNQHIIYSIYIAFN